MTRTAASRRPCTFGNTAGIHEFGSSVFMSFVIRPLRNITASEPLIKMRPRADRSMSAAPPSRTASYPGVLAAAVIIFRCDQVYPILGSAPLVFCRGTSPTVREGSVAIRVGASLTVGLMHRSQCRDSLTEHYPILKAIDLPTNFD